jgi:hypothetical protein
MWNTAGVRGIHFSAKEDVRGMEDLTMSGPGAYTTKRCTASHDAYQVVFPTGIETLTRLLL